MSKKLRELLELEFASLRVEFEHACLIGDGWKAKLIIKQLNKMLPVPFKLPEWSEPKPDDIPSKEESKHE